MTYRDEINLDYLKFLEKLKRKRLFCNHEYKKLLTVEDEVGPVDVYICSICSDRQHIRRGDESTLIGKIVE